MSHNPRAATLDCFGSKVRYWTYNKDQPRTLVLVHGFRGTHHGLQKIIDRLPDFCIVIPDLPGFGQSTPMQDCQHDIAGYADFITTFIRGLDLTRPTLVGHSFGSIVAAAVAAKHPKLISNKLVLINPIAQPTADDPRWPLLRGAQFYYWLGAALPERAGRALLSNRFMVLALSAIMAKTKNRALRRQIHQSHLQHFSTFQSPKILNKIFLASSATSVTQYAPNIPARTLLIVGAADNIAPLAGQNKLLHTLPNAELLVIPKVGHLIHHEAPRRAARAIRSFLSGR